MGSGKTDPKPSDDSSRRERNPRGNFGIMRDAQTAKPQIFQTGDGWFPYIFATNLAQIG